VTATRQSDTDRFYALMDELSARVGDLRKLRDCTSNRVAQSRRLLLPRERRDTERRLASRRPRRHPCPDRHERHHALAASFHSPWQRRWVQAGGGNHRASIFRLHVGTALLRRDDWPNDVRESWRDNRADPATRRAEYPLERAVTKHIGDVSLLWLAVPDRAIRGLIERHTIALLSRRSGGVDPASPTWLGLTAYSEKVRTSALGIVNHVDDTLRPDRSGYPRAARPERRARRPKVARTAASDRLAPRFARWW
jgi:hypothetical protein